MQNFEPGKVILYIRLIYYGKMLRPHLSRHCHQYLLSKAEASVYFIILKTELSNNFIDNHLCQLFLALVRPAGYMRCYNCFF